ncbi:transcriptional regulator [Pseudoflavonifractor sp. 524-17]|uniref:metal-sensing transcriptional repressor n=1 Tax=Pseudoflavonifractor sp. 524-17 TaxID=2304577 RepID=UPI001379E5A9|nr:transcriptional regulator [Pseudoflavonifractor sp. 524-17]
MTADRDKVLRLLKTARGQLDGIVKMVEEDRYCIDISQQVMATAAILNRVNRDILTAHLEHCVRNAASDQERQEKIHEVVQALDRILK